MIDSLFEFTTPCYPPNPPTKQNTFLELFHTLVSTLTTCPPSSNSEAHLHPRKIFCMSSVWFLILAIKSLSTLWPVCYIRKKNSFRTSLVFCFFVFNFKLYFSLRQWMLCITLHGLKNKKIEKFEIVC